MVEYWDKLCKKYIIDFEDWIIGDRISFSFQFHWPEITPAKEYTFYGVSKSLNLIVSPSTPNKHSLTL